MSSKKTNGDEPCRCRLSSLSPHRKKKCALFGKKGILLSPDAQIQTAIALDKEQEDESDQSPEAIKARIEKAIAETVSPGTTIKVVVTVETATAELPAPPTETTSTENATSSSSETTPSSEENSTPPVPPPVVIENDTAAVAFALADLSISTPASTQVTDHDFYALSPVQTPDDEMIGGFDFVTTVPAEGENDEESHAEQA